VVVPKRYRASSGLAEQSLLDQLEPEAPRLTLAEATALGASGHRARLRARLLKAGPEALADHEVLEMVLFLALPRRDTKPIARALIAAFGSYAQAIAAPLPELLKVEGLGEAGAAALKIVQAASIRLIRAEVIYRPVLSNWDRLIEYLTAVLAREKVEQVRVLYLDNRNRLIADEVESLGTVNHTPVYPRELVKRALDRHATAIILVHNHPSGDPSPSQEDIAMTREIKQAAQALSIVLHDHVIIGNGKWVSLKRLGLL
jgi:DNA repair protein RadC